MTAHTHDPSAHVARRDDGPVPAAGLTGRARPRWLVPAFIGGTVVGALVIYGVLPLSAVLYAGLLGGMLLMHMGGHGGHGGHGGNGGHVGHVGQGSHGGHGARTTPSAEDLSGDSHDSQSGPSTSDAGLDDRASKDPTGSETHDHDQRSTHGCH